MSERMTPTLRSSASRSGDWFGRIATLKRWYVVGRLDLDEFERSVSELLADDPWFEFGRDWSA